MFKLYLWMKSNQILCVSYSHEWGVEQAKRSNIVKFQLQSQFQRFPNQTLYVFSQIKDTKHIRRDFHSFAWVMHQRRDLGELRSNLSMCPSGYLLLNHWTKSNQIWCVSYSHKCGLQWYFFFAPPPGAMGGGEGGKRSKIVKVQLQSQFQRFLKQTL